MNVLVMLRDEQMNVLVMLRDEQKHYLTTDTTLFFKQQHPYILRTKRDNSIIDKC